MEPLRPLLWGEGMFLQPQHFQQQDQYHNAYLRRYFQLFSPFGWGVKSLELSESALETFDFEVKRCEVVTPDGTLLFFDRNSRVGNARIESRSFKEAFDSGGKPLEVYLGLKRLQPRNNMGTLNGNRYSEPQQGERRRFLLYEEPEVPDLYAAENRTCLLHYLLYDVQILFGDPTHFEGYELTKIAEVLREPMGKGGMLSKQYIPPSIALSSSSVLEDLIREIRDRLTAKGQDLAQYKPRRTGQKIDVNIEDIGFVLAAQVINRYIPLFQDILEVKDVHPYTSYTLLRQLIGELSTFSSTISVLGEREGVAKLPPYDHEQLWLCFDLAARRVGELLNELGSAPTMIRPVPLLHNGRYFEASFEQTFLVGENEYYLAVKIDRSTNDLRVLLREKGYITARNELSSLQERRLPGLKLEVPDQLPKDLLDKKERYRYLLIDQHSRDWQKIEAQGNMVVYCPDLPSSIEMLVWPVNPRRK
jgi:type VI secretion system protein ImpJ